VPAVLSSNSDFSGAHPLLASLKGLTKERDAEIAADHATVTQLKAIAFFILPSVGPRSNTAGFPDHPSSPQMSRTRPLIAVVDDEEPVRNAFRRLFRSTGHDVETFPSGADFLESLADHEPDCLLLDLHMPGMDGLEVLTRLALAGVRIPVVIVTGHDQPETRSRALAAGAAAYLLKPVDEETLLAAIASGLASVSSSSQTTEPTPAQPIR
jgi:CheY-like chemotaxis protein